LTERVCNINPQKLTHLFMLLISAAVRGGNAVKVSIRHDDNTCYISMPAAAISLGDPASYLSAAGTPKGLDSLEKLMLAKTINSFNETHRSRVFTSVAKDGGCTATIAIETMKRDIVGEPQPIQSGLRPDLIFLSDILGKESYM